MKQIASTEWLFYHLRKKNQNTGMQCPGILIPDTLIYKKQLPYCWYCMNKQGDIVRQGQKKIGYDMIHKVFGSQPIANVCLVYMPSYHIIKQYFQGSDILQQQTEIIEIEYIEQDKVYDFIHKRTKSMNAILQKFVSSKDGHNSIIKVNWSPQFQFVERKTNINQIRDTQIPPHNRLCTFEGPEHLLIQNTIISPIIIQDIEHTCLNISKHIMEVTGGINHISRMVLYFKIDEKNQLWLLYSTNIKLSDSSSSPGRLQAHQRSESPIFRIKETDCLAS